MIAYKKLNENIEQLCEWYCFACLATLLSLVLFPICYTGVAYYILDFESESYYLYPPTEYV